MMKDIYELELCGWPGKKWTYEQGSRICTRLTKEAGLPDGVAFHVAIEPDQSDVNNLIDAISNKEFSIDDFTMFCGEYNLVADLNDPLSASNYLDYFYGKTLLWLHLPVTQEGRMYFCKISDWCKGQELYLLNPDQLFCVCSGFADREDPFYPMV